MGVPTAALSERLRREQQPRRAAGGRRDAAGGPRAPLAEGCEALR